MAVDLDAIEAVIAHRFSDRSLLLQAVTHPSATGGSRRGASAPASSYQRLEFLGDRVVGLTVAELLLDAFPREVEGALARRFTELVRQETLAIVAASLSLGRYVVLPATEDLGARTNPALLADLCEAVIGAIFVDGGYAAARVFVVRHWSPLIAAQTMVPKDPKTALQEWVQARGRPLPVYRVTGSSGPPHRPVFTVSVVLSDAASVEASGSSKRLAEIAAATAMLARLTAPEGAL